MPRMVGKSKQTQKELIPAPKTKPAYKEFKREVFAFQASTGHSQKEVADHFGEATNTLREWQRRARGKPSTPRQHSRNERMSAEWTGSSSQATSNSVMA
jgi:transposase-like protein